MNACEVAQFLAVPSSAVRTPYNLLSCRLTMIINDFSGQFIYFYFISFYFCAFFVYRLVQRYLVSPEFMVA